MASNMASNRRWRFQFRCRGSRRESAVALFSLGGYVADTHIDYSGLCRSRHFSAGAFEPGSFRAVKSADYHRLAGLALSAAFFPAVIREGVFCICAFPRPARRIILCSSLDVSESDSQVFRAFRRWPCEACDGGGRYDDVCRHYGHYGHHGSFYTYIFGMDIQMVRREPPNKSPEPPLALAVPLSRFTPLAGGGSVFLVRHRWALYDFAQHTKSQTWRAWGTHHL